MILYDEDYVAWIQQQAALLRSMLDHGDLDISNLIDEIEGLGRSAIAELSACIRRILSGLIDMSLEPGAISAEDIYSAQSDALIRADGGVWRHVDLDKTWRLSVRSMPGFPDRCPLTIEQLLSEDFNVDQALALIRS